MQQTHTNIQKARSRDKRKCQLPPHSCLNSDRFVLIGSFNQPHRARQSGRSRRPLMDLLTEITRKIADSLGKLKNNTTFVTAKRDEILSREGFWCCSSVVEHFLGKEEVTSSSLVNSSEDQEAIILIASFFVPFRRQKSLKNAHHLQNGKSPLMLRFILERTSKLCSLGLSIEPRYREKDRNVCT